MLKHILYSLVTMIFALLLIFGSMFVSNSLLQKKENKLLSESGEMKVEALVLAWNSDSEGQSEMEEEADSQSEAGSFLNRQGDYDVTLSEEAMIGALKSLDSGTEELIHEPVEGQLSMEEAINVGINWVKTMLYPDDGYGEALYLEGVKATLSLMIKDEKVKETEPYFSFWKLELSYGAMVMNLTINAVTGQVWRADIDIYGRISDYIRILSNEKIYQFSDLAGMYLPSAADMETDGNSVRLNFSNSSIYTEMRGRTEIISYGTIADDEEADTADSGFMEKKRNERAVEYLSIRYTLKIND